jgi:hypothetical protein
MQHSPIVAFRGSYASMNPILCPPATLSYRRAVLTKINNATRGARGDGVPPTT